MNSDNGLLGSQHIFKEKLFSALLFDESESVQSLEDILEHNFTEKSANPLIHMYFSGLTCLCTRNTC